jgi:hypothetical protein
MKKLGLSANSGNEKKKKESATPNSKNPSETGRKNGYRKTSFPEKKVSLKTAGGKKTCKDDDDLRETNCKLFTTCECRPFLLTPATLILAVAAAADSKRQYSLVVSSHPALPPHVVRCNDETKSKEEDEEEEEGEEEEANDDKSRAGIATTSAHTHTHKLRKMPATRSGSSYGASELVLERLLELLKEKLQ